MTHWSDHYSVDHQYSCNLKNNWIERGREREREREKVLRYNAGDRKFFVFVRGLRGKALFVLHKVLKYFAFFFMCVFYENIWYVICIKVWGCVF